MVTFLPNTVLSTGLFKYKIVKTLAETLLLTIGAFAIGQVVVMVQSQIAPETLRFGNLSEQEQHRQAELLVVMFFAAVTLAPWIEEIIWRFLPQWVFNKLTKKTSYILKERFFWALGIIISFLFAFGHLDTARFISANKGFIYIPIGQFMLAVYLWPLMRKRGFFHCGLAHMFYNIVIIFLAISFELLKQSFWF